MSAQGMTVRNIKADIANSKSCYQFNTYLRKKKIQVRTDYAVWSTLTSALFGFQWTASQEQRRCIGQAIDWTTEESWFDCRYSKTFCLLQMPTSLLGPNQPRIEQVQGTPCHGAVQPGREDNHLPLSSIEFGNEFNYTSCSPPSPSWRAQGNLCLHQWPAAL